MTMQIRLAELEQMRTLLERHSAVAVIGPPGMGGEEMLAALEAEAEGPVIRVPIGQAEDARPYSGLEIIFSALRALEPTSFGSVLLDSRLRQDSGENMAAALTIADEVTSLIAGLVLEHPTLAIVPDADVMDRPSQLVLGHLLRRIAGSRLRFAVSTGELNPSSLLAGMPSIVLKRVSERRMADLADRLTGGRTAAGVAATAVRTASGRPAALCGIIERLPRNQLEGDQALDLPLRVESNAEDMVKTAVNGLSEGAEELLDLMSLAPLSPRPVVLGASQDSWEWFSELESRGVVERDGTFSRCSEELIRAIRYGQSTADARLSGHTLLAQRCEGLYPELHHWHRSFFEATDDTPLTLFDDACHLVQEGMVWAGIEFAERALALGPDAEGTSTLLNDLAEALLDRGQITFALRYLDHASRSGSVKETLRARALRIWAEFLTHQSVPLRLRNQWSSSEIAEAPMEVAQLQLVLGLCHALRRETAEAQELLETACSLGAHFDRRSRELSRFLGILLDCGRGLGESAIAAFQRLDATGEVDPISLLLLSRGLMMTEEYDSALATLDCLDDGGGRGEAWDIQSLCVRAEIAIRRGDIGLAIALIDKCASAGDSEQMIRRDRLLILRCWSLLAQGRASDAEVVESELTAHAMASQNRSLLAELNALQGNYLLRVGLPAEAVRHLHRCEELASNELNPNIIRYEPDLIEALLATGRREHAGMLVQVFHGKVERAPSRWAELALERSRFLLLPAEGRLEAMGRLLGSWRPEDSQFEKGVTLLVMARRLAESGADAAAAERSRLAAGIFREVGSDHLAAAARLAPVDAPEQPARSSLLDVLTPDEREVVGLVREGLKNREIAGQIFVSLRTVELRLTSVYRKLDVSSRTELIARLTRGSELPAA
ncbi:helix-turn-helix transcriptional regulator [Brevibacterium spongiae]|uniref:LuxR C-terminal-related transcriptional regulator n=1 Tax=Brevibacterium spongiae TaxID=2909672 RepID=A0ABY5SMJ3_9MICO|nr:LuxR family transcriptional regulator [Brevibacterium spongiae]UVI35790.1 LuxR C-terminal-related transcriptional regulator [Brevibacterium spongiae]